MNSMRSRNGLDFATLKAIVVLVFSFLISFPIHAQVFEYRTTGLSQWNLGNTYSDIWGYAANGREYAILGSATKIYFFNVTNPNNPVLIKEFGPYTSTSWREFKTYGHYAYAVSEVDASGLRIFDLQYLPDSVSLVRTTNAFFSTCHMPFIDEANARLYCLGTNTRSTGVIVLDLATRPDSPSVVINQPLPRGYVHDAYVRNNILYASHGGSGLSIYNCSGTSCGPELMSYIPGGYNHSSWINPAGTYLVNATETQNAPLRLIPLTSATSIEPANIKPFKSKTLREQYPGGNPADTLSIGHNPYFVGNIVYASYYTDGVQIFDASNPNNIKRIAYFDTDRSVPASYSPPFRGCWGVYPFLPSGNILASDIQSGMWIFKVNSSALPIQYSTIMARLEGDTKIKLTISGLVTGVVNKILLESSKDGIHFSELTELHSWMPDKKFSSDFTDLFIHVQNFYRLKLIQTDGNFEYSEITRLDVPVFSLRTWPNPIRDRLFFVSPRPLLYLDMIDLEGKVVFHRDSPESGVFIGSTMPAGIYFLRTFDGFTSTSKKIMINR
ncbi:MAG: choice-of-anchor B family protein [Saprospiraceae bacterium]